jgi:phage terminase large subunit-like protein
MLPFMQPRRHKIARGGRGSAKSWSIARILVARGVTQRTRWLCGREIQKSIKESSRRLLVDTINRLGLAEAYNTKGPVIRGPFGTEFVFTGLQDHTADTIKSFEDFDGAWIEEAHTISARSAQILIPTIRTPGSELWWSYNPDQAGDFVHQMAERGGEDVCVVTINWRDNPWFPAELEKERLALKALNDDLYRHVWEGECRSAAGLLFKRRWFRFYEPGRQPRNLRMYVSSDFAVTDEQDADGNEPDFTEHGAFGLDESGHLWVTDWWGGQVDTGKGLEAWLAMCARVKPIMAFDEAGVIHRAIGPARTKLMLERQQFTHVETLTSAGSKAERALGFAARASIGAVHVPDCEWGHALVDQLCAFNGEAGRVDDKVDVCSLVARGLDRMANARPPEPPKTEAPKFGTAAYWDHEDELEARQRRAVANYHG